MTTDNAEEFSAPLTIRLENFRGVRSASWTPEGMCALVGPNGSGKSSVLAGFLFMHYALKRTLRDAINTSGDRWTLRHIDAQTSAVRLTLSDAHVSWSISIESDSNNQLRSFEERVMVDGAVQDLHASTGLYSLGSLDSELRLKNVFHADPPVLARIEAFRARVASISVFKPWPTEQFRRSPTSDAHDDSKRLAHDASNVAAVLKSWEEYEHREKLEWVRDALTAIYPTTIGYIDAKQESTSKFVRCFLAGDRTRWLPLSAMSSGALSALFTLVAVAGAPKGATLLFDEADNSLHPAALRHLLRVVKERADAQDVTVCFATHSVVALDFFNDDPDAVWVADAQRGVERLTDLLDPHWLQTFKLGAIYGSAFGQQTPSAASSEEKREP